MIAYRRVFNYGNAPAPAGAVVNQSFHRHLVAFMAAMAQYFRDLTIGEVIRGSQDIEDRPFGNLATIQRLGVDLRYALDRSSYGNILALTHEVGHYLKTLLDLFDQPDIKKSFDANTKWDIMEAISNRHLGGAAELSQRAKMAESGRRILLWIADQDFDTTADPLVFRSEAQALRRPRGGLDRRLSHDRRGARLRWGRACPARGHRDQEAATWPRHGVLNRARLSPSRHGQPAALSGQGGRPRMVLHPRRAPRPGPPGAHAGPAAGRGAAGLPGTHPVGRAGQHRLF